jgi:glycyl-tRNA synthetase
MEIEYFTYPSDSLEEFNMWKDRIENFLFKVLKFDKKNINPCDIPDGERAFYSKKTIDFQYNFPFGFKELWGLAHRGQYDLSAHIKTSGKSIFYLEPDGTKVIPAVIEPSVGLDRLFFALICEKYKVEKIDKDDEREVLSLPYALSPYKFAILPLTNKISDEAYKLYSDLIATGKYSCTYDQAGSIGKRYRRQDAIGTFFCITFDFDSIEKKTVTIRERDSMKQITIKISELQEFLDKQV